MLSYCSNKFLLYCIFLEAVSKVGKKSFAHSLHHGLLPVRIQYCVTSFQFQHKYIYQEVFCCLHSNIWPILLVGQSNLHIANSEERSGYTITPICPTCIPSLNFKRVNIQQQWSSLTGLPLLISS